MDSISPAPRKLIKIFKKKKEKQLVLPNFKNTFVSVPIVPPNSMTQTSGEPDFPSTGIVATRSIHSWMASVMWGTTYRTKECKKTSWPYMYIKVKNETRKQNWFIGGKGGQRKTNLYSFPQIISPSLLVNNRLPYKKKNLSH